MPISQFLPNNFVVLDLVPVHLRRATDFCRYSISQVNLRQFAHLASWLPIRSDGKIKVSIKFIY